MSFHKGLEKVGDVYRYKFMLEGRRYHGSTDCIGRKAAEQWLRVFRDQIVLGGVGIRTAPTLGELVSQWESAMVNVLSTGHVSRVVSQIQKHFGRMLPMSITKLTSEAVQDVITTYMGTVGETIAKNGKAIPRPHTAGGAKALIGRLNGLLGYAIKLRLIREIPYSVTLGGVQEKGRPILMPAQIVPFLNHVDQNNKNPHIHLAVRLMVGMGLREGETLRARWEWFSMGNATYCGEGKTKVAKALPIPSWLLEFLKALPGDKTQGLLMPSDRELDGQPLPHSSQFTAQAVRCAGKSVGVPKLSPHGLRATFATIHHIWAGSSATETQQLVGHEQLSTTTRHYIQRHASGLREAQERYGKVTGLSDEQKNRNPMPEYQI